MPQRSTASIREHEQAIFASTEESGNIKCGEKAKYSEDKAEEKLCRRKQAHKRQPQ